MDYSNRPGPFDFEMDHELYNNISNYDMDSSGFFESFNHYINDMSHTSDLDISPQIDAETLFETHFVNDIPDIVGTFIRFSNVGSDPLVEENIQEQRERLIDFIDQSPFLSDVYRNVIETSLDEPSAKRPVPDDVFKALPIVKIDKALIDLNESCVICTEKFSINEDVLLLSCNHAYHKDCIQKWFQEQNMCPICRKKVSEDQPDSTIQSDAIHDESLSNSNSNEIIMLNLNSGSLSTSNSNEFDMLDLNVETLSDSNYNDMFDMLDSNDESLSDLEYEILSNVVYNSVFDLVNTSLMVADYEI